MLKPSPTSPAPIHAVNFGRDAMLRFFAPVHRATRVAQLGAMLLTGLLLRIALIQTPGYHDDIVIFADWFKSIAKLPLAAVYANTPGLNYPPMCVLLYKFEALVASRFITGVPSDYALNVIVKLPPILVDIIGAGLVYRIVRHHAAHRVALAAAAFIAFNPAIVYDSAYWGQNDSIPTVLALFAVAALVRGRAVTAWLALTCAILFKPPVLVLLPLLLIYPFTADGTLLRGKRLRSAAAGILAAGVVTEIIAFTFFSHETLLAPTRHLAGQFAAFSHVFAFNSLNAFNLWSLFAPFFVTDTIRFLGVSMHVWSDLIFITLAAVIYWHYRRSREAAKALEASTLLLLAFFVTLTEMHERYMYYALFFSAVLLFKRPYVIGALILSVTLVLNLEYGLTFMLLDDAKATMVDRNEFAPWLVHLCSLANIVVLCRFFALYLRPKLPSRVRLVDPVRYHESVEPHRADRPGSTAPNADGGRVAGA